MKCTIPEISWHNREPVLSIDIFPEYRNFYRLASGGGDSHVLIWQMNITDFGAVSQEVISDLTRHQKAVNCVRWSNTGQYLASGDDDANIIVWQLKTDNIPLLEGDTGDKEIWTVYKVMRGHKEDVYDLCWSMDAMKILSGSVDNTAILWDVTKGKMDHILADHKGFVQGVSWDPKNQIIATISTDRMCRIFDPFGKQIKARIHKGKLSVPDTHYLYNKEVKFFHDDTFKSFFRRLHFTPDGSLLIVPSGHIEPDGCKDALNATLVFTLDNFSSPAVILPLPHQSSTVVRCCPLLFQLHEDGPDSLIKLPYRMIFAVGTDHDIILYDTQQTVPFARFQDIHYTRLTDLTWSYDGLLLIASSTDGFCSLITFDMDELGIPWENIDGEAEENPLNVSGCEELAKDENVDTNNKEISVEEKVQVKDDPKEESKKRPSFLEQWALQKPKKKRANEETLDTTEVKDVLDSPGKKDTIKDANWEKINTESPKEAKKDVSVNRLIPRRISTGKNEVSTKKTPGIIKPEEEKINVLVPKRKADQKINVLIPRRLEPKRIEPTAGTSGIETSRPTEKQSNFEETRGIDIVENGQDSEEDLSDSEAEALSKEELEELNKASENIREFFCRVPKKQGGSSNIKPIEVRRKRMEVTSTANIQNKQDDRAVSAPHSNAKVIEVRRKPRDPVPGPAKIFETQAVTDHSDAKPIAVKRKPRDPVPGPAKIFETQAVTDHSDAKPIAVKRKPRDPVPGPAKIFETQAVTDHSDAKPIAVKRKPRDPVPGPAKIFETQAVTDHSDAKPIAVKRKPRDPVPGPAKIFETQAVTDHSDAKPIAVKRKPRDPVPGPAKIFETQAVTDHSDAKPIAVKRKPKDFRAGNHTSENADKEVRTETVETKKESSSAKAIETTPSSDVVWIIDSDDDEEYNMTPKKPKCDQSHLSRKVPEDRPPKIKVSSLVQARKNVEEEIPKKTNALLNFLQKSTEKKTRKTTNKEEVYVVLSLEENEARDAWKCDIKRQEERNTKKDTDRMMLVEDSVTEDFCLQLEDSQEAGDVDKTESRPIK